MRGILISLGIIFFCLSVEVLYGLDDAVYAETGTYILQSRFNTQPPITRDNIPKLGAGRSGLNQTVDELMEPMQQQTGVTDVMGFFGFMFQGIMFILNSIFYSTIGFYWWAQASLYVPQYMALTFSVLIAMAHAFTIIQWLGSKDIRGGG